MKLQLIVILIAWILFSLGYYIMQSLQLDQPSSAFLAALMFGALIGTLGAIGGSCQIIATGAGLLIFMTYVGLSSGIVINKFDFSEVGYILASYLPLSTITALFTTGPIAQETDTEGWFPFAFAYLITGTIFGLCYLSMTIF